MYWLLEVVNKNALGIKVRNRLKDNRIEEVRY
jgi:hypothetical protein